MIPRSRGGASTWENLVACCHTCNRKKGNLLPHEANMKLMREPRAFNLHTSRHIMRMMGTLGREVAEVSVLLGLSGCQLSALSC